MKIQFKRTCYGLVPADEASQRLFNCLHLNDCIELDYEHVGERVRTDQQRKALEVWCRQTAEVLNAHGAGMKVVFAVKEVDVEWCQSLVKDALFRPIYTAISGEHSTADANTSQYSEVHKILCHKIAESLNITLPDWPSRFAETDNKRIAA